LRADTSIGERAYWLAVQSWWIGDFLGALIITPLLLTVGIHGFTLSAHSRGGLAATLSAFGVLLVMLLAVFMRQPGSLMSPMDVPYIVYPVLVWIAMLSGPRRTALAAGLTVAIASLATTRGFGPFDSPYQLQTFLALCVLPVLLLQAVMSERDYAIEKARASDERYRAFIANSSEAIFRTELAEPMPVTLPPDDQIAWVRKHGFVAECNTAFMVALGVKDAQSPVVGTRLGDHPTWSKVYIERIREAIRNGYQVRNIEHVVHGPLRARPRAAHLDDRYRRGRSRAPLLGQRARCDRDARGRSRARPARRAAACARHRRSRWPKSARAASSRPNCTTGPAQNLMGLGLQLAEIKRGLDDRHLLQRMDEAEQVLADASLQTRTLMLELAPPGLHESGLARGAALARGSRLEAAATARDRGRRRESEAARRPGDRAAVPDRARAAAERGQTCALQARHRALRRERRTAGARRHRPGRGFRSAFHRSAAHTPGRLSASSTSANA
jgi:PAS domain-containing protein